MFLQMFGGEMSEPDLASEAYCFGPELRGTIGFEPDLDALHTVSTRIVVGLGEQSTGQICDRTSRALAERLGAQLALFPGGHTGFAEDPSAFAPVLRRVLHEN
ncbi:alpha/beta fold hydrolase [Nocardia seriolae]|uniref:Alpha/beta hydrolase n=2 Tax=Nocardia seriolae TaxID=37332 RepID=A0ABC9Z6P2_9NOCA|nr:hypothetical protein [Nocardia seriolae]GAM51070.1 alpha/beta hydrolase [Nocardia seriolae]GAP33021.1 alpha/beta hydrolase [Nocardia seriolae]